MMRPSPYSFIGGLTLMSALWLIAPGLDWWRYPLAATLLHFGASLWEHGRVGSSLSAEPAETGQ